MSVSRVIKAQYDSTCMTCEEKIEVGTDCHWAPSVGVWHTDCSPPKNLHTHMKDRDKLKKFGVD